MKTANFEYIIYITVTLCYNRLQKNCWVVHWLYCIKVWVVRVAELKSSSPSSEWRETFFSDLYTFQQLLGGVSHAASMGIRQSVVAASVPVFDPPCMVWLNSVNVLLKCVSDDKGGKHVSICKLKIQYQVIFLITSKKCGYKDLNKQFPSGFVGTSLLPCLERNACTVTFPFPGLSSIVVL